MGKDHAVRILDVETRMETSKPLKGHCGYLHGVQFCPLNKTIATCSEDGTIRTWDHRCEIFEFFLLQFPPNKRRIYQICSVCIFFEGGVFTF